MAAKSALAQRFAKDLANAGIRTCTREEPRFARSVKVFNGTVTSAALAVAVPRTLDELAVTVRAAAAHSLGVSMKAGGHGVAGRAVAGDVVIDCAELKSLSRSREGTVVVGAGTVWAEFDEFTNSFGQVTPGGIVSSTGVAGLTLGGGIGWLLPLYGLACDNLISVTGVDANGTVIRLDDKAAPDIMEVIRGYGHGLLAIALLEFETHQAPRRIDGGTVTFSIDTATEAIHDLLAASHECPPGINYSPALFVKDDRHWLAVDGVSFDEVPFAEWITANTRARPTSLSTRVMTYPELQRMLDNPYRFGQRCVWRSWFGAAVNTKQIEFLVKGILESPSRLSMILIERMAGAAKVARRPSCFPLRECNTDVLILANWENNTDDELNRGWADRMKVGILELASEAAEANTYINYADGVEVVVPDRLSEKVRLVRAVMDPNGLFQPSYR